MTKTPKHILVIRLSAMGDVAMTVPVINAFVKQHPGVKITILSRGFLKPLFENIPNVQFYAAEVKGKHKGLLGLFRLYNELKSLKIDTVADLHNVLRSKVLRFYFFKKKTAVIDKGRAEKKALTHSKNKTFKPLKSTHERYADVFRKLGFSLTLSNPEQGIKPDLSKEISKHIPDASLKWIGIAPFAQYSSKMYPLSLMEEVIDLLTKHDSYAVLLFGGGEKEIEALQLLENKYKNTYSIAGKLNLEDELKLIANIDLMLSMDSANGHLSAIFGVKTITIWGITHPFAGFAPFNQPESHFILPDLLKYPNIPCSIYGNKVCKGYSDVMQSIPPEKVVNKILEIS